MGDIGGVPSPTARYGVVRVFIWAILSGGHHLYGKALFDQKASDIVKALFDRYVALPFFLKVLFGMEGVEGIGRH